MRMKISASALLLLSLAPASAAGWAGLPPDCWEDSRIVHTGNEYDAYWRKNARISHRAGAPPNPEAAPPAGGARRARPERLSPNGGYRFDVEESTAGARITIFAEKDYLIDIDIVELKGVSETRWINENLLFFRVWWGRIAATDVIFDVETEAVIRTESAEDGTIARDQALESCPLLGCRCIKKNRAGAR